MKSIIIAGPTASGKTDLALSLAKCLGAEIVSVDSRQVYQSLTVGTAKPQGHWDKERYLVENIPYHLVDFLAVNQTFDAASFCTHARQITKRSPQTPLIFAGGTGMYFHAHFVGLDPLPPADETLRQQLSSFATQHGKPALHEKLAALDPLSAAQIPPGNIQRVMRALEICLLSGQPASALRKGTFNGDFPTDKALFVYLNWDKDLLNKRIETRTQAMLDPMAEETRALLAQGASADCPALKSLGYPQIIQWINGELSRQETLEKIITLTRQYAKRQRTWFNSYKNVLRIDLTSPQDFDLEKLTKRLCVLYSKDSKDSSSKTAA